VAIDEGYAIDGVRCGAQSKRCRGNEQWRAPDCTVVNWSGSERSAKAILLQVPGTRLAPFFFCDIIAP